MGDGAAAIVTCTGCGVQQAASRMMLGTLGHHCWRCQVRSEIAAHKRPTVFPAALVVGAALGLLLALIFIG